MRILSILSLFGPGFAKFLSWSFDELSIGNWICVHEGALEPFLVSFDARSRKYSRPIKVFGISSCFPC